MTYQAVYNKEARQWDVVDGSGEIVAMHGGGEKGKKQAEKTAAFYNANDREGSE